MNAGTLYVGTTGVFTAFLQDRTGAALANPTTLKMTLRDRLTGTIINSRNEFSLTPVGDYVSSGNVTIPLELDDNVIVGTGHEETHELILKWTYPTNQAGIMVCDLTVKAAGRTT